MVDRVSPEKRSEIMSKIRGKNTGPEIAVMDLLNECGVVFEYQPDMHGKPDFFLADGNVAVFVDGCFWHACPEHYRLPKSRQAFWAAKIERNAKRALEVGIRLLADGVRVIRIWEHDVKGLDAATLLKIIGED